LGSFIPASRAIAGFGLLAAGPSRGGQLGRPLLEALLAARGLGLQLGLGPLQPGQPLGPGSQGPGQLVTAPVAVLGVLGPVGLGSLLKQLGDLRLKLGVAPVGCRSSVGGHLGAVQGHQPQAHESGRRAQPQRLDQQAGQGLLVADPEAGDGDVIRGGVGTEHAEGDVLGAATFDLAGGTDPGAVCIQQHAQQHPGLVGGPAVAVGAIGGQEGAEVELVDDVEHEPGQVVGWEPLAQVRREQKRLVSRAGTKVVGHG
jgi:hypothetical protein